MQNPQDLTTQRKLQENQKSVIIQDRRSQIRPESVLSRIEDATYEVLRKYQKTVA